MKPRAPNTKSAKNTPATKAALISKKEVDETGMICNTLP
tara:strand:+ start:309 stop:425 length:117 start_codon:yes stop_codon:yes gene_type:complete